MDYSDLCQKVDFLGQNLVCVIVVKKGKLVASKVKPGLEALNEKRFADMFTQVQIMVGVAQTAEDILGGMEHVKVRYGNGLDVYLFPLETPSEKTILVVAVMRPYNTDDLLEKIVNVIRT
ncbi:hypothetical protein Ngar_c07830 [Candidatus Nitrososphaera gargensis Ga9.2]|uniref:Roadblock/LAMTOR2 domain-containing protein n=1 Tax=Nitrososphaera gargensis (strain Ga9.2) TaxID=1237085 RepID=K0IDJ0_NITGG|nr:hypothetical protein [Candidatus Nitrososphaera gargensis]AFU57725.1 hypothetical protein Ngar_c07830 [Candidatus Nitrososphaera gargensis Ga9.2]